MIRSSKGFIQGYNGLAVADKKSQIIVTAEAVGTANEGEHLPVLIDKNEKNLEQAGVKGLEEGVERTYLWDANFFSEKNLEASEEHGVESIIPDSQRNRGVDAEGKKKFEAHDFKYNGEEDNYECPNGKKLEHKGQTKLNGGVAEIYQASLTDCKACPFFSQCSWSKKEQSEIGQGRKLLIVNSNKPENLCNKMREKMGTEEYQEKYSQRIAIVEPVFANIRYCKRLNRFTLRGKEKVNCQWKLYCMVHNLEKCLNEFNERRKSA